MRSRRRYGVRTSRRTAPGACGPPPSTSTFDHEPHRAQVEASASSAQTAAGDAEVVATASIVFMAAIIAPA
jgi:hypothetical protein